MKYRIILLPTENDSRALTDYATAVGPLDEGYRLDQNHIPHITIVAFEAEESASATVRWEKLKTVLMQAAQAGVDHLQQHEDGYIMAHLTMTDTLQAVFHTVRETLMEDIDPTDFAKYSARPPHITIGVELGRTIPLKPFPLTEINFDRLALAQTHEYGSVEGPLSHLYLA